MYQILLKMDLLAIGASYSSFFRHLDRRTSSFLPTEHIKLIQDLLSKNAKHSQTVSIVSNILDNVHLCNKDSKILKQPTSSTKRQQLKLFNETLFYENIYVQSFI